MRGTRLSERNEAERERPFVCRGLNVCVTLPGANLVLFMLSLNHAKRVLGKSAQEPVVFVNGRPYVLRTLAHPFRNMKATGIATEAVEAMERRLRDDLRADAAKYGGHLLLHGENDDFTMKAYWENVRAVTRVV